MGAELWLLFKSPKELKRCKEYIGADPSPCGHSWDVWFDFKTARRLEIGFTSAAFNWDAASMVRREICRRFDVTRIGDSCSYGYWNNRDFSTPPTSSRARKIYGAHHDWVSWAKDYKAEWSHSIVTMLGTCINRMTVKRLREIDREVTAWFEARDKETGHG